MLHPNELIHATSPYLLQHAYNPIAWYPWGKIALAKAQQEDKPILLSIGYSSCHWCHVMAKESFEDKAIAAIMNQYFVCIKVDREERPDLDQVYVAALQAMGIQPGWPLHVFLFPNQQPFYGGTYFPPAAWKQLLQHIIQALKTHRKHLETSASHFTQALQAQTVHAELLKEPEQSLTTPTIQLLLQRLYQDLDMQTGGMKGAPKFPMPSLHACLLDYYRWTKDLQALEQLETTLKHMAYGGIYDQLGGGFARYATDEYWLIPHFEKMLYDNAQLMSLYAQAYLTTQNVFYQTILDQTITFIKQEMLHQDGGFYSALDADTEGIEGKFYLWNQKELVQTLGQDAALIMQYYNVTEPGNWEKGYNILYRSLDEANKIPQLTQASVQRKLSQAQNKLRIYRNQRPKPKLDDKIITSWNGMMLQALIDAYYALDNTSYLELANNQALFISKYLIQENQIWHSYRQGNCSGVGYLEDYAWVSKAFISLYQATLEESWLYKANQLVNYANTHYWDEKKCLFYFTNKKASDLIARTQEVFDQVIPSSNAVMAHNLFNLGHLLAQPQLLAQAQSMLHKVLNLLQQHPVYLTHWASLYIKQLQALPTVCIIGTTCVPWAKTIKQKYPEAFVLGTHQVSKLPLLVDKKPLHGRSTIYICYGKTCLSPVHTIEEACLQLAKYS
jgi:uncharacterized protein YyaL (SSP411 family)